MNNHGFLQIQNLVKQNFSKFGRIGMSGRLGKGASRVNGWMRAAIADQQRYCCGLCNQLFDGGFEIDHKVPQVLGGSSERSNLWALCKACHAKKTMLENSTRIDLQNKRPTKITKPTKIPVAQCLACQTIYSTAFKHVCCLTNQSNYTVQSGQQRATNATDTTDTTDTTFATNTTNATNATNARHVAASSTI